MKILPILMLCLLLCGCGASQQTPATTAPTETAQMETAQMETTQMETTQPQTTQAPLPPVITKDPTSEKLSPGGKTWFVAHADGATILTWEFLSPDEKVYSITETMDLHPGLELDASQEDTVSLRNVPLSLNGWSARARFDGPGGSTTTQSALITVSRSEGAYDEVIETYRQAVKNQDGQYDVSEMMLYASHVGYARLDLDADGTDELLVAGIGYDIPDEPCLFEIFTLDGNTPVSVARSTIRSRLFLMQDNKIYNEGSSGVSDNYSVMQFSGGQLRFLNGLYTTNALADGSPSPYTYYFTTSNQYGDLALLGGDNGMEEKVANTFLNSWRGSITLPELCLIG